MARCRGFSIGYDKALAPQFNRLVGQAWPTASTHSRTPPRRHRPGPGLPGRGSSQAAKSHLQAEEADG